MQTILNNERKMLGPVFLMIIFFFLPCFSILHFWLAEWLMRNHGESYCLESVVSLGFPLQR